jgi:hypothetical protein
MLFAHCGGAAQRSSTDRLAKMPRLRLASTPAVRRYAAAFAIALAVFGAALVLILPSPNGDEPHYVLEAVSIARDLDRDLTNEYDDPQLIQDVYGGTALEPHAFRFPGGHGLVSVHSPGLPLLLAPVAAVTESPTLMRAEIVVIAAIGAMLLMMLLDRVPFGSPRLRWLAWLAAVLAAPFVVYATALYPEAPAATLSLGAAVLLTTTRPGPWALAGAAMCAGFLPWLNVRFLPLTLCLAAIGLWRAWGHPRRTAAIAGAVAPIAVLGIAFAVGFQHWYGSPWPSAQYALSTSEPTLAGAYRFGVGGLFSAQYGWFPKVPVHLLAVVAIGVLVWRLGRPALIGVLVAALYLAVIGASGVGFPGSSYAGRQLVVLMPLAAIPILVLLATNRRWWTWGAFAVLGLVSLALTVSAVRHDASIAPVLDDSLEGRYNRLWPSYDARTPAPQQTWTGDPARLAHDVGAVREEASPGATEPVVLAAPRGARGVLEEGTTPPMAPSAFAAGVHLRAAQAPTGEVARIEVRDDRGELLAERDVPAAALPPEIGFRAFLLPFHTERESRFTFTVRTTGNVALLAGPLAIGSNPTSTLRGSEGVRDVAQTVALIAALVLLAVALTVYDRRRGSTSLA